MNAVADITRAQRLLTKAIDAITTQHLKESGYVEHDKGQRSGYLKLWNTRDRKVRGGSEAITPMYAMGLGWVSSDTWGGGMVKKKLRDLALSDLVLLYQAVLKWHTMDAVETTEMKQTGRH